MFGTQIGKYQIIECIGHGGMADVYKALHPELDRIVALKVLNRALVRSPEMLERFRREARAIAALRHPNIVQVFDLDVIEGVYFMVMEYIEGETLAQSLARLRRSGERMLLHEMLRIIITVGGALHYAHEQKMLHRDIKPSNVMFRDDGSVVLTDFGVAKILDVTSNITATGTVAGTPAYMAPEQWTDDEPDRRSDIYSLGVVLYEMVTGELPFRAETPGRLMFKHISEQPPLPRELCQDLPAGLERVILRAMAKDPQERYQTAGELVDDLKDVIYRIESTASTGIFLRPARAVTASKLATAPRTRLLLGAGAILVLMGALVLLGGDFIGSTAPTATPNATGTALADRLAVLEATLSVTPLPATPTPTRTLQRTPSPVPITCVLTMTLLQDDNYSDYSWWGSVNARFDKTWRLRNDGDCPWPRGTVLVHLDGRDFGHAEPFEVNPLPAGAEVKVALSLRVPGTPGNYTGRFQLQTAAGEPIGEPLVVKLQARPRATPTATVIEPLRVADWELIEWRADPTSYLWWGKVQLGASGGTGQYTWYRDTLDNPLPGDVLEFEWGICRAFFGSVWVTSGDQVAHRDLYIFYPGSCD